MEESLFSTPRKNVSSPKEVFKDFHLKGDINRDSPESVSLNSDYESGQQYEDKDLPSGYNSGEQYDTISNGYVSGEKYELPDTRVELLEPTLACIDEISVKSDEDMFTLAMPHGFPENSLLQQTEMLGSSSSSSIHDPNATDIAASHEHKIKRKKTVSYHVSVPIDKSPLGPSEIKYRDIPSDTDTTSCFDSDGTYIRSEGQSSDSGAALLSHHRKKVKDKKPNDSALLKGNKKRIRKAKEIIRNHEHFFEAYDNKYWAATRKICFWGTILFMLACIVGAAVGIALMPQTCDPPIQWWEGGVNIAISASYEKAKINLTDLIENVRIIKESGIRALKFQDLYIDTEFELGHDKFNQMFDDFNDFGKFASKMHDNEIYLIIEIPVHDNETLADSMVFDLEQRITKAIVFWAKFEIDGISLVGMEHYAKDPYLQQNIATWKSKFIQYGKSPNTKILTSSYLLPENVQKLHSPVPEEDDNTQTKGYENIKDFSLLDAEISLEPGADKEVMQDTIKNAAKWDFAPNQPWIDWKLSNRKFSKAQLAFLYFLPGTISVPLTTEDLVHSHGDHYNIISKLTKIRKSAVPIYMNKNFKTCHSYCSGNNEKEENFVVHIIEDTILLVERFFSRRNRYMVVSNIGSSNISLGPVTNLYSGGELILDTESTSFYNPPSAAQFIKFKDASLASDEAIVIKFPK